MIIKALFRSTISPRDLDFRVTLIPGFFNFSILKILRVFRISLFQFFQFFKPGIFQFSIFKISRFEWYFVSLYWILGAKVCLVNYQ